MSEDYEKLEIPLDGQIAVVTGGGRGLGQCTATTLARRGAAVAVVDVNPNDLDETMKLIEAGGGRGRSVVADVTDADAVRQAVDTIENSLGPIDLLVNNAGLLLRARPLWEADPASWKRVMEVNLYGTFLFSRFVLPGMIERRRGRIINLTCAPTLRPAYPLADYRSSKTAVTYLTTALAAEVAEYGIQVFAVLPGAVRTPMTDTILRDVPGWNPKWIPKEQTAGLIAYLASGKADSLSGRCIPVKIDLDLLAKQSEEIVANDLYVLRLKRN